MARSARAKVEAVSEVWTRASCSIGAFPPISVRALSAPCKGGPGVLLASRENGLAGANVPSLAKGGKRPARLTSPSATPFCSIRKPRRLSRRGR